MGRSDAVGLPAVTPRSTRSFVGCIILLGFWFAAAAFGLADHQVAAGQALADIIVGVADQLQADAAREERAEAAAGRAPE